MLKAVGLAALCFLLPGCVSRPDVRKPAFAQLDHIAVHVADIKSSAAFYEGIFGFRELKNPFPGGGGVIWLDAGNGVAMHIFGGRTSKVTDERERHFAVTVADLSHVTDFLASHGMDWQNFDGVSGEVQTRPDGVQQLFFRDPDGYWVEVNDALKRSAAR
jgi:catechol 2,3-dioxygenase-like lactoylglutathione lyase family enzyme